MRVLSKIIGFAAILAAVAALDSCSSSSTASYSKTKSTSSSVSKSSSSSTSATAKTKKVVSKNSVGANAGQTFKGQASYYADKFHGKATASGEKYDKSKMTCAHRTLPFGTKLRVTNTANGKSVDVTVNDRGPFKEGRVVDVSRAAAEKLDMIQSGVINCTVKVISTP